LSNLTSGDDILNYRLSMPKGRQSRCCVVFVHAGDGNMLGPHRMFEEFERALNKEGFASLRFVLAGCGDSTGESAHDPSRDLCSVNEVLKFISEETDIDNIVLLGMSRGAYTAFNYMRVYDNNVNGLILLSLPITPTKMLKKALLYRIKEYSLKLTSRKTYVKFFRNQINYKLVFRTFLQVFSKKRIYSTGSTDSLGDFPVLLLYGENDPALFGSKAVYLPLFESASSDVACETIDGANHSFFHYKWKEDIMAMIVNWLKERY
jgi:pimeloyl-ACP methyl ester carboxylesterase